jgi:hypothetical protein
MEWHHLQCTQKKKFKKSLSAAKVMITVSWDSKGVILVDETPTRETINSDTYIKMLTQLRKRFKRVQPHKNSTEILLRHDNAKLHTSLTSATASSITEPCQLLQNHGQVQQVSMKTQHKRKKGKINPGLN